MNLSYISGEAWAKLAREHSAAHSFLLGESLDGELRFLQSLPKLDPWEKNRLAELKSWREPRIPTPPPDEFAARAKADGFREIPVGEMLALIRQDRERRESGR